MLPEIREKDEMIENKDCDDSHKRLGINEIELHLKREDLQLKDDEFSSDIKKVNNDSEVKTEMFENTNNFEDNNKTKARLYTCMQCNEVFKSKYSHSAHKITHTGDIRFSCEFCDKKFPARWSLNIHRRKHFEIRSFKCDDCGKSFKSDSQLRRQHKSIKGAKGTDGERGSNTQNEGPNLKLRCQSPAYIKCEEIDEFNESTNVNSDRELFHNWVTYKLITTFIQKRD
ncbi:zf-H2C2 2 domain containing protein, partial [Asbolus verrucosus]